MRTEASRLEWVIAGIGALFVVCVVAYALLNALFGKATPPDIVVRIESVRPLASGQVAQVVVQNRGDEAAMNVHVVGSITDNLQTVELAEVTVDHVPPHAQRRAGLVFRTMPGGSKLEAHAVGYALP